MKPGNVPTDPEPNMCSLTYSMRVAQYQYQLEDAPLQMSIYSIKSSMQCVYLPQLYLVGDLEM